jgi:phosphotriesterase-related protein
MTADVDTVRGPIATTGLGVTLMHIHNDVLPALRQRGVTEEQITTMLVDNPREIFSRQGGY